MNRKELTPQERDSKIWNHGFSCGLSNYPDSEERKQRFLAGIKDEGREEELQTGQTQSQQPNDHIGEANEMVSATPPKEEAQGEAIYISFYCSQCNKETLHYATENGEACKECGSVKMGLYRMKEEVKPDELLHIHAVDERGKPHATAFDPTSAQAGRVFNSQAERFAAVLQTLVNLKDIHDNPNATNEQKEFYTKAKPLAWEMARKALKKHMEQPTSAQQEGGEKESNAAYTIRKLIEANKQMSDRIADKDKQIAELKEANEYHAQLAANRFNECVELQDTISALTSRIAELENLAKIVHELGELADDYDELADKKDPVEIVDEFIEQYKSMRQDVKNWSKRAFDKHNELRQARERISTLEAEREKVAGDSFDAASKFWLSAVNRYDMRMTKSAKSAMDSNFEAEYDAAKSTYLSSLNQQTK